MKKFLLLLCVMLTAIASDANVYTLFDSSVKETGWEVNTDNQFELLTNIRGTRFTFVVPKDPQSSYYTPGVVGTPLRFRKDTSMKIECSSPMTEIKFTFASFYTMYIAAGSVSEGWTQGEIVEGDRDKDVPYTLTFTCAEGQKEFTFTSTEKYIQIGKIEVTDSNNNADEPITPDFTIDSIDDLYAGNVNPGDLIAVNFDMTVGFANGRDIYARDRQGRFIHILGPEGYASTYIIPAGWMGTFKIDNGYFPTINSMDCPEPLSSRKGTFTPAEVPAEDAVNPMNLMDLVNNVFVIKNVVLAKATPFDDEGLYNDVPFIGTSDGVELTFSNKYNLASVGAGTYDIRVLFIDFEMDEEEGDFTPIFYVIDFAKSTQTGVEVTESDNVAATYYNLQGMKVESPSKGIFIRNENGKSTKVLL